MVAECHDLDPKWLNDRALPFAPHGFHGDGTTLFNGSHLKVIGPEPRWVFLMKLDAARPGDDYRDMVALWPLAGFTTPAEAVAAYYDAYPHAREDEYLEDYVAGIAAAG